MTETPLLGVLERLLGATYPTVMVTNGLPSGAWKPGFVLLSYERDFDRLWGLIEKRPPPNQGIEGRIDVILMWDGIPSGASQSIGQVAVHEWLTAYDWLLAFMLKTFERPGPPVPPVRVFVIDLRPKAASFAERTFPEFAGLLPWLRIYRPVCNDERLLRLASNALGRDMSRLIWRDLDLHQLLSDLGVIGGERSCDLPTMSERETNHETLRPLWINELTKAESRHSISNLIAPLQLAEEMQIAKVTGVDGLLKKLSRLEDGRTAVTYLRLFLEALGLLRPSLIAGKKTLASPLKTRFVEDDIFEEFGKIRFLLVDDNADLGYHHILSCLIFEGTNGAPGKHCSLEWEKTPDCLVAWIKAITKSIGFADTACVIGADQEPSATGLRPFDILFLDLRLFGPDDSDREKQYLRDLIGIYTSKNLAAEKNLALERAVAAAKSHLGVLNKAQTGSQGSGFEHLLLLPTLLSVLDPSLPIVLFSSTQQRHIVERLVDFPNIVTTFTKPLVSGYRDEEATATEHVEKLHRAITAALELHEKRTVWRRLALFQPGQPPAVALSLRTKGNLPEGFDGIPITLEKARLYAYRDQEGTLDRKFRSASRFLRLLKIHFRIYLLDSRYHDFSSIPFEFLEGLCAPLQILDDASWQNVDVSFREDGPIDVDLFTPELSNYFLNKGISVTDGDARYSNERNYLAGALQNCRNRKAHGYGLGSSAVPATAINLGTGAPQRGESEVRAAAILQFLMLLDFLEGRDSGHPPEDKWREICERLVRSYRGVEGMPKTRTFFPWSITAFMTISWPDFALFALTFAQVRGGRFLHSRTTSALDRLANKLWLAP